MILNWRNLKTSVVVTNVPHTASTRIYDVEDRIVGYALTNAVGRGVSVSFAYDGSYRTNAIYTLPNGNRFTVDLTREAARRELVTRRAYSFNGSSVYSYSTDYDLIGRPTNAVDSASLVREWMYNRRSELTGAMIGGDSFGYDYDTIGNRLWSSANAVTNTYLANNLNQYTCFNRTIEQSEQSNNLSYDADGNLINDGRFTYAYDAENRLTSVTSSSETNGAIRVLNAYDHKHRRIRKTVQRLHSTIAPPPSPPIGTHEWQTIETHDFVWDGNNIVLETISFADGTTRACEYFWGPDKSGTEQGAGGVGGLLAVSIDGVFYIPFYDHNGNIVGYISETGSIAAQYLYDPYGNIIDQYGTQPDQFYFGFSTKYHDREISMIGYQRRFYCPDLGRWLNRDPIEEEGGENLYAFCTNAPVLSYDINGCWAFIDNVIAFIGGAVVGVACQAVADIARGEVSGWESYLGSAIGGGVLSEILLHYPAAAGMSKAIYGGVSGFVGSAVRQACEVTVSGKKDSFSVKEFTVETVSSAALSMAPFVKIRGINRGKGSYLAVARSVSKKMSNGSISHVAVKTTMHSFIGESVEYGTVYSAVQPLICDGIYWAIDRVKVLYTEQIGIHLKDKCGNEVNVNYQGSFDSSNDAMGGQNE